MVTAKDLNKMSNSELANTYNQLAAKPVKKFRDKATAIERVSKLIAEQEKLQQQEKVKSPNKPGPKQGVGEYAEALLMFIDPNTNQGLSYSDILKEIHKNFPTANTEVKSLGWYASKLRREGEIVPERPRSSYK